MDERGREQAAAKAAAVESKVEREMQQRRNRFLAWLFFLMTLVMLFGTMGVVIGTLHGRVMRLEHALKLGHGSHSIAAGDTTTALRPGPAPGSDAAKTRASACEGDRECEMLFDAAYEFAQTGIWIEPVASMLASKLELGSKSFRWVEPTIPIVTITQINEKTTRVTFGFAGGPIQAFTCENWKSEGAR